MEIVVIEIVLNSQIMVMRRERCVQAELLCGIRKVTLCTVCIILPVPVISMTFIEVNTFHMASSACVAFSHDISIMSQGNVIIICMTKCAVGCSHIPCPVML